MSYRQHFYVRRRYCVLREALMPTVLLMISRVQRVSQQRTRAQLLEKNG